MVKRLLIILALVVLTVTGFCISAYASDGGESLEIEACTLSFSDSVYLVYAVSYENLDVTDIRILYFNTPMSSEDEYTAENADYTEASTLTDTVNGKECVLFKNRHLCAMNMTDYVYARAYAKVGGKEIYSPVVKYSVLDYAYYMLGYTGDGEGYDDEDLHTLLNDMLAYGAAAQKYFDHNTDNLASSRHYLLTVEGATLPDGSTHGLYLPNDEVVLTANQDSSKPIVSWYDSDGRLVGSGESITVTLDENNAHYYAVREDKIAITIDGADAKSFKIYYSEDSSEELAAATALQSAIADFAGYELPLTTESTGNLIKLNRVAKDKSADSFAVYTSNGALCIDYQYPDFLLDSVNDFIAAELSGTGASASFDADYYWGEDTHYTYYSDYGAVGDGITDDFYAIQSAHSAANSSGETVVADKSKTYNMGSYSTAISVKTDVIWTDATFIIDDSSVEANSAISKSHVFNVAPSKGSFTVGLSSLSKGATNIGMTLDGTYLIIIENSNVKQYIRYGANADSGNTQQEAILVHADGSIDPSTPVLWNYDTVTKAVAYYAGDEPISIVGGSFITVANRAPRQYTYYARGINITRSNVTVKGLSHIVNGEGDDGAPYNGFLCVNRASNVTFDSVIYSGHKTYALSTNASNKMGTYDINANLSANITWVGCTQHNDITDDSYWGVMGTNYCKNLTYDSCTLSRFDAHKGTYNATIRNSTVGHAGISLIGSGVCLIENSTVYGNRVVLLRNDYGSTWEGDMIIKDVTLVNTSSASVIQGTWYNHNFGYTCYLPTTLTVDNLKVSYGSSVSLFNGFNDSSLSDSSTDNPVVVTKTVIIKNNLNGYSYTLPSTSPFADTQIISE